MDVRKMTQHDLRERIGYVPQKGVLFSGTIDSNIRYGKPEMSQEDVKLAAEIAQSDDFIEAKPEGYQCTDLPGRNQCIRRPEAASVHSKSHCQETGDPDL